MRRTFDVTKYVLVILSCIIGLSGMPAVASALESPDGGVVVTDGTTDRGTPQQTTSSNGIWDRFVRWFLRVSDLEGLASQSVAWTLLHAGLIIIGLLCIAFGPRIYWVLKDRFSDSGVRKTSYQPWAVRMIGGALIVLAFIV